MKNVVKVSGISFLVFFGWEFSNAQGGNNNTNTNQVNVQTQNQPASPSTTQPTVLNAPLDGSYSDEDKKVRRVVPPAVIRYADVMWKTRIWRNIDIREKINQQLYFPVKANGNRISLFELLKDALQQGEISAYEFDPFDMDNTESMRLTKTEVGSRLFSIDSLPDENGNIVAVKNDVDPSKIKGYTIKEDWHFEKQRSVLDPRILWICPYIAYLNKNTGKEDESGNTQPLFWIYFNDIRPLLARTQVFNGKNDAEWRSFDDIFWKRQFSSYIIQQSNVFNRAIGAYLKGLDAILEGEKMHNNIAEIESNMWSY